MKKTVTFKNVLIIDTIYTLFLYMLLVSQVEFEQTFFFISDKLPDDIYRKLTNSYRFKTPKNRLELWMFRFFLFITSSLRWKFIKNAIIYGVDNSIFSSGLVKNNPMILLEDGASNYSIKKNKSKFFLLKKLLFGNIAAYGCGGISPNIKKILLTGLLPIPIVIKEKVEIFSPYDLWDYSSKDKRRFIMDFFDVSDSDVKIMSNFNSILFTQPLSEDSFLLFEEKKDLYLQLLQNCNKSKLLIKVHPRDKMDYKSIFKESYIFNKNIPMELLTMLGITFEHVYTIFSTAALSLPYKTNIHFMGTTIHPKLVKSHGIIDLNTHINRII